MDLHHPSTQSSDQSIVPHVISGESLDTRSATTSVDRSWWRTAWATRIALVLILLLGAYFRTLGLFTWESGTGQHPDERFFTDVASRVRIPTSVSEYFDSSVSPGNPRNVGKTFYVYGAFPIALTRLVAVTLTPNEAMPETVLDLTAPTDPQTGTHPSIANPELGVPKLTFLHPIFNPAGDNLTNYHQIYKVGRSLVVLFDLGSILLVFLIGQRLFDRRVGLLAALLMAMAVMPIQQSHFFVDPIFSTFFTLLSLYWAVRVAQSGSVISYVALGTSIGLAMANRITMATLGLVAIAAAVLAVLAVLNRQSAATDAEPDADVNRIRSSSFTNNFIIRDLPLLCLAGLLTLLTFRVFQPDAFVGSMPNAPTPGQQVLPLTFLQGWGFFDVRPDPRFIGNLREVQGFVSGETDFYPSQQWVRRADYLFPWKNMVIWGMGPALGLTVWIGWLLSIVHFRFGLLAQQRLSAARLKSLTAFVLWIWIAFYFAWQGQQFASTLRYMLPIYGALIIFGAWLLITLWDWSQRRLGQNPQAIQATQPSLPLYRRIASVFGGRWSAGIVRWVSVVVVLCTLGWAYAFTRIYTQPHSRVIAARWILDHAPPGSKIISEQWDDALPLAVDGGDPWGTTYQGISTAPYGEDDHAKYFGSYNAENEFVPGLLDQLEQADYITLTSNRVYGSTVRLPMRYPALMRYYHHLFAGGLGFELVADITSYPQILGIPIPDQSAEEAFTVYDHPRILIFEKTSDFSRERAEQLITADVNWDEVYKLPVNIADRTATALRLTESEWPQYRAAGTWSNFFNHQSLVNTFAPLIWLLVLELLGLATFALLFRLLPWLPDRGFALARVLGLLVVAYAAWMLGSLNLLAFSPLNVWLCALPLLIGGAWVAWRSRTELWAFWRERSTALLTAQGVYLVAFLVLLLIRWFNPDLWHPARGGEKPMDFAYLNAVLKSAAFPPYDPWFAGGYINYYYFGFVIVGTLTHLTTIMPSIAYNLAVTTLFALTALGAWGVVYNLLSPQRQTRPNAQPAAATERWARSAALLAPVFVLLVGNLVQAIWYLNGYAAQQQGRTEWAFWDATRIVDGTVNEFPFFTFLFADLHAHMIVIPFALAMLGLTVALTRWQLVYTSEPFRAIRTATNLRALAALLILLALLAGTLRATNTWDYPTYVGLTGATLGLLAWQQIRQTAGIRNALIALFGFFLAPFLVIVVGGNLLFLPFIQHFVTESSGAELLREGLRQTFLGQIIFAERTPLAKLLVMHGLWLFLVTSAGIVLAYRRIRFTPWQLGIVVGGLLALIVVGARLGFSAPILLIPLLIGALGIAWHLRRLPPRLLLPMMWVAAALALSLLIEFVVVRGDVGRMNTVFKFGIHIWTLFGLAAAIALPWLWRRLSRLRISPVIRWTWRGAALVLIAAALVYPVTATPARIADRYAEDLPNTLDGAAFMQQVSYTQDGREFPLGEDAAAIRWLQQNVTGTPIILEAHLPSYQWAGRIATYTGLPTILGWEWHQIQQRNAVNATPIISHRQDIIAQIYGGSDPDQALQTITEYGIEYIYVGGIERALYDPFSLGKFDMLVQQGDLEQAFTDGDTTIYRVMQPGTPTMLTTDLPVRPPHLDTPPPLKLDQSVNELPVVNEYAWNGWANANPWLALLVWIGVLYALTALGLPLALLVFGHWRDGGVVWARLIGLLLLGYAVWLPTSYRIWHYNGWGVLGGTLLGCTLNGFILIWMGRATQREMTPMAALGEGLRTIGTHMRDRRRGILLSEGLFLGGFLLFVGLRALNPDLWHPIWGGEKPMELGFLNAILRSPVMPPYDPFFSDGYINYYYYGLYLVSLPIKITGIDPAIAFNLVVPMLFGLTLVGGYAIVAHITGRRRYGLLGAAFLTLLGNLGSLFPLGWSNGLAPVFDTLQRDGIAGLGAGLGDWYIGPSRIIPDTINEFPFWSFLFADLHPHVIALPITLLAIALAYQAIDSCRWMMNPSDAAVDSRLVSRSRWGLIALTLGTLAVTNSWDFPTYTLLVGAALVGGAWRMSRTIPWLGLVRAVLLAGVLAVGGLVLYTPFFDHFYALISGIDFVRASTTIAEYLVIYGLFLAVLLPVILGAIWRVLAQRRSLQLVQENPTDSPSQVLANDEPGASSVPAQPSTGQRRQVNIKRAIFGGVVFVTLVLTLAQPVFGLRLWLFMLLCGGFVLLLQRRLATSTWFAFLLALLAWSVSLGIEVIFIADHLAGGDAHRMNTVFKFGLQIWALMSLAAAASLPNLLRGLRRLGGPTAQSIGLTTLGLLIAITAIFPLVGTPSRIANRFPVTLSPTLDGLAFMHQAEFDYDCNAFRGCEPGAGILTIDLGPDAAAIDWLNQNLTGTPIVLQSNLWFYRAYGIRIAANTGFPTVVSALHVNEQRDPAIAARRDDEVEAFYRTTDIEAALRLLARYRVDYVYVGSIEHTFYNESGLQKFAAMEGTYLDIVYDQPDVQIYKVREIPATFTGPEPFDFAADEPIVPAAPVVQDDAPTTPDTETAADSPADLRDLEERITTNPTNTALAFELAERYRGLGRYDDAAETLAVAAEANPDDTGLHHLWGDILAQAGRYEEAEETYLQAARNNPTAGNWNKLGTGLLEWDELDKAEIALNQALATDATEPEPHYRLGQLHHKRGDDEQAVQALETYLDLAPDGQFSADARQLLEEIGSS